MQKRYRCSTFEIQPLSVFGEAGIGTSRSMGRLETRGKRWPGALRLEGPDSKEQEHKISPGSKSWLEAEDWVDLSGLHPLEAENKQ